MEVEFLIAWDNHSWTTQIVDIPDSVDCDSRDELCGLSHFF